MEKMNINYKNYIYLLDSTKFVILIIVQLTQYTFYYHVRFEITKIEEHKFFSNYFH